MNPACFQTRLPRSRKMQGKFFRAFFALSFMTLLTQHSSAFGKDQAGSEPIEVSTQMGSLSNLSLEQLMDLNVVTSASKYAQSALESPSAVTVLTREDIEKSGTLDILQLLRFTPGVLVVEEDSNRASVNIRGVPAGDAGRNLLLIDGVPYYFSGDATINWHWIPISVPDIERVEVIRGPSSPLYGVNAYSGVINITTKEVAKQDSLSFHAAGGTLDTVEQELIWNHPLSDKVRYRLEGKFRHDNGYGKDNGDGQIDAKWAGQGMLDVAWDISPATKMKFYSYGMVQRNHDDYGFTQPLAKELGFIGGLGLHHDLTKNQSLDFLANYQKYSESLDLSPLFFNTSVHDLNSNVQYTNHFGKKDTLLAGASVRFARIQDLNYFSPAYQNLSLMSFYLNNDFRIRDNLILTTGGRYEYDSITHSQFSGRANLTYLPWLNHSFRASIARAVRTPSINQARHFSVGGPDYCCPFYLPIPDTFPGDAQGQLDLLGNSNLKPESVLAVEAGYQGECFNKRFHPSVQFFYNRLSNLIYFDLTNVDMTIPYGLLTWLNSNRDVHVYGVETDLKYTIADWWKTDLNYTYTHQTGELRSNVNAIRLTQFPTHVFNVKNRLLFKNDVSVEVLFNWTSSYVYEDIIGGIGRIKNIRRLDARLAKKFLDERLELAVVGQNLIHSGHRESSLTKVDRRVYGTLTLSY